MPVEHSPEEAIRHALQVSLDLWAHDVEPGDFDRDVIEPLQRGLEALTSLTDELQRLRDENARLLSGYDEDLDRLVKQVASQADELQRLRGEKQSPEEHVKAAVLDAMQNEYDYEQVCSWVDDVWIDDFTIASHTGDPSAVNP